MTQRSYPRLWSLQSDPQRDAQRTWTWYKVNHTFKSQNYDFRPLKLGDQCTTSIRSIAPFNVEIVVIETGGPTLQETWTFSRTLREIDRDSDVVLTTNCFGMWNQSVDVQGCERKHDTRRDRLLNRCFWNLNFVRRDFRPSELSEHFKQYMHHCSPRRLMFMANGATQRA